MSDLIDRKQAIDAICDFFGNNDGTWSAEKITILMDVGIIIANLPSAQPEPFVDADKFERCRFEYINACKIAARPTPDTSKNDIYDANAVIKALHPIFGDVEF